MLPWLSRLWDSVKRVFWGFYEFLAGTFTGDMQRAWDGLGEVWAGTKDQVVVLWDGVRGVFTGFVDWLTGTWVADLVSRGIAAIKQAWTDLRNWLADQIQSWVAPIDAFFARIEGKITALRNGPLGRAMGLGDSTEGAPAAKPLPVPDGSVWLQNYQPSAARDLGLNINVKVDQGRVVGVEAVPATPGFRDVQVSRGPMTDRA